VAFCKRYKGQVCPFHRDAYSGIGDTGHQPHPTRPIVVHRSGRLDRSLSGRQ
jgi:hypothetical protein